MTDWVRGPALETVRMLNGFAEGDEVIVDTAAWYRERQWNADDQPQHYLPTSVGTLKRMPTVSQLQWMTILPDPRDAHLNRVFGWVTAHRHIIAWRPQRGRAKEQR